MLIKALLLVTWSCCVFIPMMTISSVSSIEIPCINSTSVAANSSITPFPLVSNQSYTLTNCMSDVVFIDIALRSPLFVFENVTVRVTGGTVLQRLSTALSNTSSSAVRNIHVVVEQAHVTGDLFVSSGVSLPLTMLDISSGTTTVQNISVSVADSSLRFGVTTANGAAAVVAPLLFLRPGSTQRFTPSTILSGVTMLVVNSFLSVNVSINGASNNQQNTIVMASLSMTQSGVMELIQATTLNSTFVLIMVSAQPPEPLFYQGTDAAILLIRSDGEARTANVALRGASLSIGAKTNITVRCRVPRKSNDVVAAVTIGNSMQSVEGAEIFMDESLAMIENVCGSNCSFKDASHPRARVVCIAQNTAESNLVLSNIRIVCANSTLMIDTPASALFITVQNNAALRGLLINVSKCSAQASSSNLNIGSFSRTQAVVDVSSSGNATEVYVSVRQLTATFFAESGDCMIASSTVVGALDNISYSRIEVVDVVVTSRTMNGTIFTLYGVLAPITMGTSIVNIAMQSTASLSVGVDLLISVTNATLDVLHATTVPTGPQVLLVVSIASIVNVVRLLTNSTISVANSHIVRSFPSTYSSLAGVVPGVGARYNITAVVNLFDATSAILGINPQLTTFASLMYNKSGGQPPTIVHINVSTRVMKNCTVSYNIAPQSTDCVALVMSPGVSNMCTYTIEDTQPLPLKLPVGSIFGAMGQSRLVNSNITARRVRGLFALMFSSFKPTSFEGPLTTLMFNDISLQYADYGIPMYRYPIGSQDTAFVVDMQERFAGRRHSAVLTITHSLFKGFTSLLMPDSINITSASAPRRRVSPTLLALGCNVWDDVGLPHTRITSDTTVLSYVQYPWSVYNESIACHGLPGTSTVSVSTTVGPLRLAPPLPAVSDLTVSTAYHSTSSAVYASLISVSTGGAVASLERGVGALRLASQCSQSTGNVDAKAIAPPLIDSDVDEPMSYDLSANPLRLQLPVGRDSLQYAAGASVGNAVFSCVIDRNVTATLRHCCSST
ncbi:Hypothetical protein, putative [Bodo saltans]|uniref:Membrane-associated protein n=1 Tax=Bodo saltans TaxID=75058 RepID=A0A0S4J4G3_BODSA|nr:Hypothetical protein, putative [Bodo saltans]|eukprot:CUG48042.1 Hypothetical protein, putative [Bodo saltans]